jgi:hypothetical protein
MFSNGVNSTDCYYCQLSANSGVMGLIVFAWCFPNACKS